MDDFQAEEETAFVVDEVRNIIIEPPVAIFDARDELLLGALWRLLGSVSNRSVEATIGGNNYQASRVNQWTTSVVEQCLSQLSKLGKPFKYVITCVIMQKTGAGLQTASSCFWDNTTDGSCPVTWENKSMYCIVNVFGLAI